MSEINIKKKVERKKQPKEHKLINFFKNLNKIYYLIFAIVLVVIFFVIYKIDYLKEYSLEIEEYNFNTNTYEVKTVSSSKYLYYNDVRIQDIFKKYTYDEEYNMYYLYDSEGSFLESYSVSSGDKYLDIFLNGVENYYTGDEDVFEYDELLDIVEKNDIENDIDLIKFVFDNVNNKSNFFTSFKNIKLNYYIKTFVNNAYPLITKYDLINGNFDGIIIYDDNSEIGENTCVNIYTDEYRYVLTFSGSELTTNDIVKLLGTVVIE